MRHNGIGQAGDDMPEHDPMPAECIDRTNPAWRDMLMAATSSLGALVSAFDFSNGASNSKWWLFSLSPLYYTLVKFKAREK